ncbi:MAG TPA: alpha/beta hydrolase [Pyrinomonadaceae bacterium]|jgi:proline iminopeptidase|nr:alpha/beta hydrolase [Pyrinomonadaceae bacterium]
MKRLLFSLLLIFIWQASGSCLAQTPQEGYINTPDGVRLFYKIVGSGSDTLLAVHGGPGNSLNSILADLEPLAKKRRVIYYDQRGNGRSDLIKEPERLAISKHIADLETVRLHFKLDKITLLGNSWGGLLVSAYAAAHPDRVQRMILHSPAPPTKAFLIEDAEEIQARVEQRFNADQKRRWRVVSNPQTWVKADDPRAVCREFFQLLLPLYLSKTESASRFKGDVCSGSEEAVRSQQVVNMHVWRSLGEFNLLPSLGVIKAPVLVIHGAADPIPVEASEAWAAAMPNARLLLLKDSGHIPQIEQPEMFFKAIETFLKGEALPEAKKVQASTEKK